MKRFFVPAIGVALVFSSCNLQQLPQPSARSISDLGIQIRPANSAELQLAMRSARSTNEVVEWSRAITVTQPNGQANVVAPTRSRHLIGITIAGEEIGQITLLSVANNTANFSDSRGDSTRTISFDNTGRVLSDTATENSSEPQIYIAATCGQLQDNVVKLRKNWENQSAQAAITAALGFGGMFVSLGLTSVGTFGLGIAMVVAADQTMQQLSAAREDFHENCVYNPNRPEPRY